MTELEIAQKYVYGEHDALTDNQEIIDMVKDITDLIKKDRAEQLILQGVSERLNSIDFSIHLEALTPLNRISVHPSPRTLGVDEIYDKYKRQQERNAR